MTINTKIIEYINERREEEFDSFYVYDSEKIREHCREFQNISYNNKAVHFASMANVNQQFLQVVKEENVNVFVNSIHHLQAVEQTGFKRDEIIFTSSALSKKLMKQAEEHGVQLNVDSQKQLMQWLELFPDKAVGIRCNIGDKVKPYSTHAGSFIGKKSRLGFTLEEIDAIADKSKIKGLHMYVGTDIFDINYFIDCYKELIAISDKFNNLDYINFGGGFGVNEEGGEKFNFDLYNSSVSQLMEEVSSRQNRSLKLIIEPGRIIGGAAGYFVCCVTDVKNREEQQLIGVNASTVQFPRPLLYSDIANHPVAVIRNGKQLYSQDTKPATIYGCSTYSRDIFSNKKDLPQIEVGDIVVLGNAGSYCASSYMSFLGFKKPEEYFV